MFQYYLFDEKEKATTEGDTKPLKHVLIPFVAVCVYIVSYQENLMSYAEQLKIRRGDVVNIKFYDKVLCMFPDPGLVQTYHSLLRLLLVLSYIVYVPLHLYMLIRTNAAGIKESEKIFLIVEQ